MRKIIAFALAIIGAGTAATAIAGKTLALQDATNILFNGSTDFAYLGTSMASGDFNGDGFTDLAMGAYKENSPRGVSDTGAVTVYFGGGAFAQGKSSVVTPDGSTENLAWYGAAAEQRLGVLTLAADLDGDGYDDLVTVAEKSATGNYGATRVYVKYGGPSFGSGSMTSADADVSMSRTTAYISALAAGDFNGDGKADLAIADNYTGAVYVLFGGRRWASTIDLASGVDVTVTSSASSDLFQLGGAVNQSNGLAIGDVNGDDIGDLAIGVPRANNDAYSLEDAGKVYVFYGKRSLPSSLQVENADVTLSGGINKDQAGGTLAIGDVTGDGIGDLLIGAPESGWGIVSTTGKGRVLVVKGSRNLSAAIDLYKPDLILQLADGRIGFKTGQSLMAADVNGDGIKDIVVGSPGAFYRSSTNGWLHVIYGGSGILTGGTMELEPSADLGIYAPDPVHLLAGGRMATSVAIADFNGDGKADIAVGGQDGAIGGIADGYVAVMYNPAGGGSPSAAASFDLATGVLTIAEVQVAGFGSFAVEMQLTDPAAYLFSLTGAASVPGGANPATFDLATGTLIIPQVAVGSSVYQVQMQLVAASPTLIFQLTGVR